MRARMPIGAAAAGMMAFLACTAIAQEPPEAVYEKFHRAARAANVAEMGRVSTDERRLEIADSPKMELMLGAQTFPVSYKITGKKTSSDGNDVQLRATGMHAPLGGQNRQMYGIVDLVKQKGVWKVDAAAWADDEWPPEEPGTRGKALKK